VNRELSREEHEEIVSKINTSGMKWEAKVYDHLVGKSFAQINKRAGRKKYFQGSTRPTASAFVQTGSSLSIEDMPKEFDWKQYIKPARSQEECGSCYTIAAMAMLSSRLRRQGQDVTLSVQHSLNCNYYNQVPPLLHSRAVMVVTPSS
jgi:C1A family cysteine protease